MTSASVVVVRNELPATAASESFLRDLDRVASDGVDVEVVTFRLDTGLAGRCAEWRGKGVGARVEVVNIHDSAAGPDDAGTFRRFAGRARRRVGGSPAWQEPGPTAYRTVVPRPSGLVPSEPPARAGTGVPVELRASGRPAVRARADADGRSYQLDHLRADGSTYLAVTVDRSTGERKGAVALDPAARRATRYGRTSQWEQAWFAQRLAERGEGSAPVAVVAFSTWGLRFLSGLPGAPAWTAVVGSGLTEADVAGLPAARRPSRTVTVDDGLASAVRAAARAASTGAPDASEGRDA